jgi:hypothetical protein
MVRDDLLTTPRVSRREFRWKPDAQRQITGTRCSFKHEKWRKNLGVTKEHLSYDMGFWNVEGLSAYAVISGTLTVTTRLGAARRSLLWSGFRIEFDIAGTKSECWH